MFFCQKDISRRIDEIKAALTAREAGVVVCVCRRGNDSQLAVQKLGPLLEEVEVVDVVGGLNAYAKHVDTSLPIY